MSTYNLCFEQKYKKKIQIFLSENLEFLEVTFSIYLNRRVFVMKYHNICFHGEMRKILIFLE